MTGVGHCQNHCFLHTDLYDFCEGKKGPASAAAKYAAATPSNGFSIQEDKPYAEVCPLHDQ